MHRLIAKQIAEATDAAGQVDIDKLAALVGSTYEAFDRDRSAELDARERDLQAQNDRFDIAINNMTQGLLLFDSESRLIVCNQSYIAMYGLSPEIIKPGIALRDIIDHRRETGAFNGDVDEYCAALSRSLLEGKATRNQTETPDGRTIMIVNKPVAGGGWVATHEDVTERRRAEAQIRHLAHYDALTDLPNRALFHERLREELGRVAPNRQLAVLYIDVDEFKTVNDTLGHAAGDELLQSVAASVCRQGGPNEFIARLGGDEFAIMQTAVSDQAETARLVTRVFDAIRTPFECLGHQVTTDASVGVAMAPQHGTDLDQILKNADLAMYAAKAAGRRTSRFFEPAMDARVKARRMLETNMRQALIDGAFEVYYQP